MPSGFTLVSEHHVEECKSRVRLWRHEATGARLASFCNSDENKVFGVSFRTPPENSTGLPHILEHSVLCGSERYPVKEPFVELLKGSLQTFLNAFTFPDKTCYPVASANTADFRNLTEVYLDAVFFPLLGQDVLDQEGWHLEPDGQGGFLFKGVVYNEMKGVFSSPEAVLSRHSLHLLFPDTVYGLESGGDPEAIPSLRYDEFFRFHQRHYHPSNAYFFFWGDDDENERLEQVGAALQRFEKGEPAAAVALQKPFTAPVCRELPYAASEEEKKELFAVNWLLADTADGELFLSLRMLEHILLGLPASPLRRALLESGLGEDLTGGGLEEDLRQSMFSVGLRGLEPGKAGEAGDLILTTLKDLVANGIPKECVDAAVNSVEFALREKNTGRFPVGLAVMLQALTTWLHDGDPLAPLRYEEPLANIKRRLAAGERYFEDLIRSYFLENPHRVTVVLRPDPALAEREAAAEKARVDEKIKGFGEADKQAAAQQAERLQERQETPDDPALLARIPRLAVSDLPRKEKDIPLERLGDDRLWFHDLPTGGIGYVEAVFELSAVPVELFPLLPLFSRALLEIGTKNRDFADLNMSIARITGGMDAGTLLLSRNAGSGQAGPALPLFTVSGKATPDNLEGLFTLLAEVVLEARFDNKDLFGRMVLEEKARLEHNLIPAGHSFVMSRLRAACSVAGHLGELTGGISQLAFLRELALRVEADWPGILADLERLRALLLNREGFRCNITAEAAFKEKLVDLATGLAAKLPRRERGAAEDWGLMDLPVREALILPAQVNYVGAGANLFTAGYTHHGSAHVILKYLRTGWLWEKVRVQGGAYGAFCFLDRITGSFGLVSYRDPNIERTINTFMGTAEHLSSLKPNRRELDAAIIGAIGEMDAYMLPDSKGMASFTREVSGDTKELRSRMREEIFSTTAEDFRNFGVALGRALQQASFCALGGADLEKLAQKDGWETLPLL